MLNFRYNRSIRYATIASYYIYLAPYCHTFWVIYFFWYLEVWYNTCNTILTNKQSVYFLQYKYEVYSIIYMNKKYNYYAIYTYL